MDPVRDREVKINCRTIYKSIKTNKGGYSITGAPKSTKMFLSLLALNQPDKERLIIDIAASCL